MASQAHSIPNSNNKWHQVWQSMSSAIKSKKVWKKIGFYVSIILFAIVMFFPFYWMLIASLKSATEITATTPSFWPSFNFGNWWQILTNSRFIRYLLNSLIVAVANVALTTVVAILAAFALSKLKIKGRAYIIAGMLVLIAVPFEVLVITNFSTMVELGFYDSLPALFIPFAASVYYTMILRNSFLASSDKIYHAARIDGASNFRYLTQILIPQAKPTIISIMLFAALASWNSIMWPTLIIRSDENMTLTFLQNFFKLEDGLVQQEMIMAASLISIIPTVVLFVFFRKYMTRGVNMGGTKG
ncbi:MAG: carbohydrate ABC transporter permease [Firmicutes bacterium]|nr:carbohydrate ABC transporter permease [Bacillota bacterium]MCL1954021.1 carbohydrate ABC transporter permease [Bacillota bacterium]